MLKSATLPEETLDDHGDEDALDDDTDDGLSGGQLGLERVEAEPGEEDAPRAPVRSRLPSMETLGDGRHTHTSSRAIRLPVT